MASREEITAAAQQDPEFLAALEAQLKADPRLRGLAADSRGQAIAERVASEVYRSHYSANQPPRGRYAIVDEARERIHASDDFSIAEAARTTGHNALVVLGGYARDRERFAPEIRSALRGLPAQATGPLRALALYDKIAKELTPDEIRPAREGAGMFERAMTETVLPHLAGFADPVNLGVTMAGGAAAGAAARAVLPKLAAPLVGRVAPNVLKAAVGTAAASAGSAGGLGAFEGVGAAQRGEDAVGVAKAVGHGAAMGAMLGPAHLAPWGTPGKLLAEVGVFAYGSAGLEGRLPNAEDWVNSGVMVGGLRAARSLSPMQIRGLVKPKAKRTGGEQAAVEAIPEAVLDQIGQEIKLLPPGRPESPILGEGAGGRNVGPETTLSLTRELERGRGDQPGTGKPIRVKRKAVHNLTDEVLLEELAKPGHPDAEILRNEMERRTAPPGGWRQKVVAESATVPEPRAAASPGAPTGAAPTVAPARPVEASKAPARAAEPVPAAEAGRMLAGGESTVTTTGRRTSPFPRVDVSTNARASNTVKRVDDWLAAEAIAEAEARGDAFAADQFRAAKGSKLTQADRDGMNYYLFDAEFAPPAPAAKAPKPTETPAPAAEAAKEPWEMTRDEYERGNPHDLVEGGTPEARAAAFDALPGDAQVWVFHATDPQSARRMLASGISQAGKPRSLARERYEEGASATFSPGAGLGAGVYVGSSPVGVEGYGRDIVAIRVPKGRVVVPPEGEALGKKSAGLALADSDAMILGDIPAKDVMQVSGNRYSRGHAAHVASALASGKPVPPEVLADYPGLAPKPTETPKPKTRAQRRAASARLEDPTEFEPAAPGSEGFLNLGGGRPAAQPAGAPGQPGRRIPWLNKQRAKVSDQGIEDFFRETGDAEAMKPKLGGLLGKLRAGVRERFVYLDDLDPVRYALARDAVRTMPDEVILAGERAVKDVERVLTGDATVGGVTPEGMEVLRKKIVLEDMLQDLKDGKPVSRGFTQPRVEKALAEINATVANVPSVAEAYKLRQALWRSVGLDLAKRGVISAADANRATYIRHFVVDYMGESAGGPGTRLRNPRRGYAKEREGTERDISTDYIEVEVRALAEIRRDNAIQDSAEKIAAHYAVAPGRGGPPPGIAVWKYSRDGASVRATTPAEKSLAKLLASGALTPEMARQAGVPPAELARALSIGTRGKTFWIPQELAARLDNLPVNAKRSTQVEFSRTVTQAWKRYILRTNPIRYNVRNAFGDGDRTFAARGARPFKLIGASVKELMARDPKNVDWMMAKRLGVIGSGRSGIHELGGSRRLKEFDRFLKVETLSDYRKAMLRGLRDAPGRIDDISAGREDVLRYAVYKDALAQVDDFLAGKGRLKHLAGSQAEIEALARADRYRAAAKISRETLGDYGKFTPWENDRLRNGWAPFYSWLKINTSFWPRVFVESARQGGAGRVGGAAAVAGARGLAGWAARVGVAYGALALWNNRDEATRAIEEKLPPFVKSKPHVILPGGGVLTEPSALSDFTEWFDLDEIASHMSRYERGEIGMQELLKEAMITEAQAPLNKIFQSVSPFPKAILTLAGVRSFPDLFEAKFFAQPFSNQSAKAAVLDILGSDVKRFVDASKGERTWGEVFAYYFSGNAYRPMPVGELAKAFERGLEAEKDRDRSRAYTRFYADFGDGDRKGMRRAARAVVNSGGSLESLENSVRERKRRRGEELTAFDRAIIREAYTSATGGLGAPDRGKEVIREMSR